MKRNVFWLGMLVMVLVFGMTVVGCETTASWEDCEVYSSAGYVIFTNHSTKSVVEVTVSSPSSSTFTLAKNGGYVAYHVSGSGNVQVKFSATRRGTGKLYWSNGGMHGIVNFWDQE